MDERVVVCHVLDLEALADLVDAAQAPMRLAGRVPAAYLDRIDRVNNPTVKLQALGEALLVAGIAGLTTNDDLAIGEWGKPEPASGAFHMNLSYSAARAVLGLSPVVVGVDIQPAPAEVDRNTVRTLRRGGYPVPPEMDDHPERLSPAEFAHCWTQVEAILKAEGTGFCEDLRKHQDWFDRWQCRWASEDDPLLPSHALCVATREGLEPRTVAAEPADLLQRVGWR